MRKTDTQTKINPVIVGTTQVSVCQSIMSQLVDMKKIAVTLAGLETALFLSQATSAGPKVLCSYNQRCSAGEPFGAAQAASNKNGVVGITGKNAPMMPSATQV